MSDHVWEKLEAWLQYFADLRLDPFFRDRRPLGSRPLVSSRERRAPASPEPAGSRRTVPPVEQEGAADALERPVASVGNLFALADRIPDDSLERIRADIGDCTRCKLHRSRTQIVFGDGNPHAELVFVGEGPGEEEDRQGLPFVGRAGQLLNQMIQAMGLERRQVYICNVVKCRPPGNRTPEKDEVNTCLPFLERQLSVIRPKVIVCLGSVAVQALMGVHRPMSELRGKWFDYRGMRLLATYHPAYLLRNPAAKRDVWSDLQKVMAVLGLRTPRRPPSTPAR